jgi:serine/threonine protein kinase
VVPDRIGRYEIQRRLGTGGMGSLYLANDPLLDRLVAIKLLKDDYQDDTDLRERFAREARSVARLRHPNIVIVFDVGEDEGGRPFMAMEYISGETLTRVFRRDPALPLVRRLGLMEELCAGLSHAHGAGIVHRDVKPANLMLDGEGVLKILDFGIARLANSGMTQDGMMMGSVNYMSPEQIIGRGVDHHTDIFASGAVLYEAIALEQAFPGAIDSGVLHSILEKGPVPLDQRVPGIDPELVRIVQQALEREPERRYDDINVMRRDIARVRRRLLEDGHESGVDSPRDRTIVTRPKTATSGTGRPVDSDRRRKMDPERFAEVRRQQVEEHLHFSRDALAKGDHDAALQHAERAATVDPDNRLAFELLDKARFAIEAKAVRKLLSEAQRLLSDGHVEDAAGLAGEASAAIPDLEEAEELRNEVSRVSNEIAAERERRNRIESSLLRARTSIEHGGYETALRAVYEVLALDPERPEARELEQVAKSRLQAKREHEQARQSAYERLTAARTLADQGKFDEAADAITAVVPPSDTVRLAAAEALASVRTSQRKAAADAIVAEAQAAFSEGQFDRAVSRIDSIAAGDLTDDARALRAAAVQKIREQRELIQRREVLENALASTQALIAEGNIAKAYERLQDAVGTGLDDERIASLRRQIGDLAAAAEARRRDEARDRVATKRIAAARQLFDNGDGYAAVALLERDASGHQLVEATLAEMRATLAAEEERVRQEAEQRRQEQEARRRAEIEAARLQEERRLAAEKQRRDEERRLEEERRTAQQAAEKQRLEDERRLHDAERARIQREVEKQIADARARFDRGQLTAAREAAEAALSLDPQNSVALTIRKDVDQEMQRREAAAAQQEEARKEEARQREQEALRREQEARQREQQVTKILKKVPKVPDHEAALGLLNDALALAPGDSRVQTLMRERSLALENLRAEEQRRAEAREKAAAEHAARLARERLAREEQALREREGHALREQEERARRESEKREAQALRERQEKAIQARREAENEARREAERVAAALVAQEMEATIARRPPSPAVSPGLKTSHAAVAVIALLVVVAGVALLRNRTAEPERQAEIARTGLETTPPEPAPSPAAPPAGLSPAPPVSLSPGGSIASPNPPRIPVDRLPNPAPRADAGRVTPDVRTGSIQPSSVPPPGPAVVLPIPVPPVVEPSPSPFPVPPAPPPPVVPPPVVEPSPSPVPSATSPARPPLDAQAADSQNIAQVLNQYVAAYNALDAKAVENLIPGVQIDFAPLRSYHLVLSQVRIVVEGDTATVTCVRQIDAVLKRGNSQAHQAQATTLMMRRSGRSWVIASVK